MRNFITAATILAASTAGAETLSDQLSAQGIAATLEALETDPTTPAYDLAAVHFLRGAELSAQGAQDYGVSAMGGIFLGMMNNMGEPLVKPLEADTIPNILASVDAQMQATRDALGQIASSDPAVVIDTAKIWLDANDNGQADEGESLADYLYELTGPPVWRRDEDDVTPTPVIRFDGSDIHWLAAYTHLVSGTADFVTAFDLEAPTAATLNARTAFAEAWGGFEGTDSTFSNGIDEAATILAILDQRPNPESLQNAKAHYLNVISENRQFWAKVAQETDNDREWIPNDAQSSGLDFEFPGGIGDSWLQVLADAKAILTGEQLIPFWRLPPTHGINISKLIDNPPSFSLPEMVQGSALLPYVEQGPVASSEAINAFGDLTGQNFGASMIILN